MTTKLKINTEIAEKTNEIGQMTANLIIKLNGALNPIGAGSYNVGINIFNVDEITPAITFLPSSVRVNGIVSENPQASDFLNAIKGTLENAIEGISITALTE